MRMPFLTLLSVTIATGLVSGCNRPQPPSEPPPPAIPLAISELVQAVNLSPEDTCYQGALGHVYAVSGHTNQARKVLHDLESRIGQPYVPAYAIALVYAGLGDNDRAISWLQKAFEDRSTSIAFLKLDPELSGLHSDPRFKELARRINF